MRRLWGVCLSAASLALLWCCHADEQTGVPNQVGVPVAYRLPADGPLPRTYRVTLAVTEAGNPDWIVGTFVAGGVRTVTKENRGRFTDYWNGLDENDMPVPPGRYGVRGIYMPAEQWKVDGNYHTLVAQLVAGVGDSWFPTREHDDRFPWFFGHAFGDMCDVQVGPNGVAGFWAAYLENSFNPFLVDLNRPIGWAQVLQKYPSGGTAGGLSVACDGEVIWAWSPQGGDAGFLFRADRKPFGKGRGSYLENVFLVEVPASSLCAWHDVQAGKRYLYATQTELDKILTLDGDTGELLATTVVSHPQALMLDKHPLGGKLLAMHRDEGGKWQVAQVALRDGVPIGDWSPRCPVADIANPVDCETDSAGNFYVLDTEASQVYKLDPSGKIVCRFAHAAEQRPGHYDDYVFMSPVRLATWTDARGADRVIVVEHSGPGRVSEWGADGKLLRQWFLIQNANHGYSVDPAHPENVCVAASFPASDSGLIRFKVNYDTGAWSVDAVWPDICHWGWDGFPGGTYYAQMFNLHGSTYIAFPFLAGLTGQPAMIYKLEGDNIRPCAGVMRIDSGEKDRADRPVVNDYWWTDSNGDGAAQKEEYIGAPIRFPSHIYWGDQYSQEMNLLVMTRSTVGWAELPLKGFDRLGNPLYDPNSWHRLLYDPIYRARRRGKADALHGANEIGDGMWDWARIVGSHADGYYVEDVSGPPNPGGIDTGGNSHVGVKLSRYVPDGHGGFRIRWRVGRKAWRVAHPGEVYGTQHVSWPVGGLVGTWDMNGLYHVYTDDGMYVDTLMGDAFAGNMEKLGVYVHGGEAWYGRHFLNRKNGKVYLLIGRPTCTIYEVPGWTGAGNPTKRVTQITPQVTITAAQIAPANEYALRVRGGAGQAQVARFTPGPGGGPALDGSLRGWEPAAAVQFSTDPQRAAEVRCMYDPRALYLRWHLRMPEEFKPADLGDPARIFTHERHADTMSFYIQGDPNAPPSEAEGRPGDTRIVFSVVSDAGRARPIALAMYAKAPPGTSPAPVTYHSPVGQVTYERVALLDSARLAYATDEDNKGLVVAAAIPVSAVPWLPPLNGTVRTLVDFSATLGGITALWWANRASLPDLTSTTDEPSEARLYPAAWAQAEFVGMDKFVVHEWLVCGPWGGDKLKDRPVVPHPGDRGHIFTKAFFAAAHYPPDDVPIGLNAVYTGPLTQDVGGQHHEVRWRPVSTADDSIETFDAIQLGYAATWIHAPAACELDATFVCPEPGRGVTQVWLNDAATAETVNDSWSLRVPQVIGQQRIALTAGWNKVLFRGYAFYGPLNLGLELQGPEDLLWGLSVSATPPG